MARISLVPQRKEFYELYRRASANVVAIAQALASYLETFRRVASSPSRSSSTLGTYGGGWRIIRTLGQGIYAIGPPAGFAAQATAGVRSTWLRSGGTRSRRRTSFRAPPGRGGDAAALGRALGPAGNIVFA